MYEFLHWEYISISDMYMCWFVLLSFLTCCVIFFLYRIYLIVLALWTLTCLNLLWFFFLLCDLHLALWFSLLILSILILHDLWLGMWSPFGLWYIGLAIGVFLYLIWLVIALYQHSWYFLDFVSFTLMLKSVI